MGSLIEGLKPSNMLFNLIANSRAQVRQRLDAARIVNIVSSPVLRVGDVDNVGFRTDAGVTTSGVISSTDNSLAGTSGKAAQIKNLSTNGWLQCHLRVESKDAEFYRDRICAFQIAVAHDVSIPVLYQVTIMKPSVADNFAGLMHIISDGSPVPVNPSESTVLSLLNVDMSDCRAGIEIRVRVYLTAGVTLKTFDFTEWALTVGSTVPPFFGYSYAEDLAVCSRYLHAHLLKGTGAAAPYNVLPGVAYSVTNAKIDLTFPTRMFSGNYGLSFQGAMQLDNLTTGFSYAVTGTGIVTFGQDKAELQATVAAGLNRGDPVRLLAIGSDASILISSELF